eukprot:10117823-Karenia_brevis.AAC.1
MASALECSASLDFHAKNVHEGIMFSGIALAGDDVQILPQLPDGGVNVHEKPVLWTLPDGRCESWSARDLANLQDDQLAHKDSAEEYRAVANHLGYDHLG